MPKQLYLNPPIQLDYMPYNGWKDLSKLVDLAMGEVGVVKELTAGSNAGPTLAPMWEWVGERQVGTPWAAAYIVWTFGRYFKYLDEDAARGPNGEAIDPKRILGMTPIRQQFARLGPANVSGRWKGVEKYAMVEGKDQNWVWFQLSSGIDVRKGDIAYWVNRQGGLGKEAESGAPDAIYNGYIDEPGSCGICNGVEIIDNSPLGHLNGGHVVIEGDSGNNPGAVRLTKLGGKAVLGFLRYVGPQYICTIDGPINI